MSRGSLSKGEGVSVQGEDVFVQGKGVFVQGRGSLFGGGLGPEGSPPPVDRMTNISDNITFTQLRWRVVTRNFAID